MSRNVMLHIHNVAILGGVPTFIVDLSKAFPQFFHVALHIKDWEDRSALQMMNDSGIHIGLAPEPLSAPVVREYDPAVVILHNISGKSLEGNNPWPWLKEWPTIFWHHSTVRPFVPADMHIFVSEWLKSQYANLFTSGHIKKWKLIPPCIESAKFSNVSRNGHKSLGKIATPTNKAKYPEVILWVAEELGVELVMPGADQHYKSQLVKSLTPSWHNVPNYLSQMGVFLYVNDPGFGPETWGRCVTEAMAAGIPVIGENRGGVAEQIQDGVTGFLVDPSDRYLIKARVEQLLEDRALADKIGEAGRMWVRENADISTIQSRLSSDLLSMLVGSP